MGLENEKPKHLYRIVKPDGLVFDHADRLLPHRKETFLQKLFHRGSVPMVTAEDVEFIEDYFGVNQDWLKLTIETHVVENLRSSKHGYLKNLEYFGIVPRQAIIRSEKCTRDK